MAEFKHYPDRMQEHDDDDDDDMIPVEAMPNTTLPKPSISIDNNPCIVKVVCLESPSSFFLHLQKNEVCFEMFTHNITSHYSKLSESPLKVTDLPVGSTWAVLSDGIWYRASIIKKMDKVHSLEGRSRLPHFNMMFVDYGFTKLVNLKDIYYLEEEFTTDPPFAVHCQLAEVFPTSKWKPNPWEKDAIDFFCDFCCNFEEFSAVFLRKKEELQYEVVLESFDGKVINEDLVLEGFAQSSIISRFHKESNGNFEGDVDEPFSVLPVIDDEKNDVLESLPDWDPMAKHFFDSINTNYVDDECAEATLNGFQNLDDRNICKYYRKKLYCPRGETCRWLHILPRMDGLSADCVETYYRLESEITLPIKGSFVQAIVATIYSPNEFYIQILSPPNYFQDQEELCEDSFAELQKDLQSFYKNSKGCTSSPLPAVGELMVVCHDSGPLSGHYRVRVLMVEEKEEVTNFQILYIDIGNTGWVKEHQLRTFTSQFLRPAAQAVRCYLAEIAPVSYTWKSDAKDFFANYVMNKVSTVVFAAVDDMDEGAGVILLDLRNGGQTTLNEAMVDASLAVNL